jgi:alpha-ketoglutarate-dependent 2,4-dichlorophenoxyacetate dioxygenase
VSLFLSSHAGANRRLAGTGALMPLRDLMEHGTQRERVYRHKWRVGDLVMWDNQSTMHRARPYDDLEYPRDLRRTALTSGTVAIPLSAARPSDTAHAVSVS